MTTGLNKVKVTGDQQNEQFQGRREGEKPDRNRFREKIGDEVWTVSLDIS